MRINWDFYEDLGYRNIGDEINMAKHFQSLSQMREEIINSDYEDCKANENGSVSIFASSSELPSLISVANEHGWEYGYVQNTGEQTAENEYTITFREKR